MGAVVLVCRCGGLILGPLNCLSRNGLCFQAPCLVGEAVVLGEKEIAMACVACGPIHQPFPQVLNLGWKN